MRDELEITPNDVIKPDSNSNLIREEIFTADKLFQLLENSFGTAMTAWLSNDGVECEVIRVARAQGWEKGRVRLKIEFIPDENKG